MKKILSKWIAFLLVAALTFSLAGCSLSTGSAKDDDKKSESGKGKEFSEEDEEAVEVIGNCVADVYAIFEMDFDYQNISSILSSAKQEMENTDLDDCSKEVKKIYEESELFVEEMYEYCEIIQALMVFSNDFEASASTLSQFDYDLTQSQGIADAYYAMEAFSQNLGGIAKPEYFTHAVDDFIKISNNYTVLLYDMYTSVESDDYVGYYSALCMAQELLAELEDCSNEIGKMMGDVELHLTNVETRMSGIKEEIEDNIKLVEKEDFDEVEFKYLEEEKKLTSTVRCIETIYPAMYNRLDAVSILSLSCMQEEMEVLISVEVDGFSQKYEKTVILGMEPQLFYVKPPVISSGLNLSEKFDTQIKVSVSEVGTGNVLLSDTQNVTIMSINDFILSNDEYGYTNYADILAWVTPESEYVQQVLRYAAQNMYAYTGTEMVPGYQYIGDYTEEVITLAQVYAIQKAISDMGVRYVNTAYSIGDAKTATQRVKRPDEILVSQSGICIETSVLMASALQSAGLNAMIVLTDGHCQVAVETWDGSGEYMLIETTVLPVGDPYEALGDAAYIDYVVMALSDEEWATYLANKNGIVYNCNMATDMGITPLIY